MAGYSLRDRSMRYLRLPILENAMTLTDELTKLADECATTKDLYITLARCEPALRQAAAEIRTLRAENERLRKQDCELWSLATQERDALRAERSLLVAAAKAFESAITEIDQYGELDCYVTYQIAKDKMSEWRATQSR